MGNCDCINNSDVAQVFQPNYTYFRFVFASRKDANTRSGERAEAESARIPSGCESFSIVDQGWEAADDAASHPWLIFWHPYGMPASSLRRATSSTVALAARRLGQRPLLYES
jgi:hypothetical protein